MIRELAFLATLIVAAWTATMFVLQMTHYITVLTQRRGKASISVWNFVAMVVALWGLTKL